MSADLPSVSLPEPCLLKLPDDGEGYSDEAPYIWAWFAHGYDTGMTPYFSDDQMKGYAAEYCAAVVSERDALAGRVAELEAALQGFYRNSNRHDWPADVYDAATAALPDPLEKLTRVQKDLGLYDAPSATTPESKP